MAITYERKKQRQNNILYTIVAAILICVVFFAMVVSFFIKAEDDAYEMLHIQTKQIKDDLTLQLKSDRENLITMANFASKLYADGKGYERMFDSFKPIGLFSRIGILNPDGTFITKDGVYDLKGQISFEEQALLGEHITGRTYSYSMPDEQVVRSSVPIRVNGETVGIMYGIIKIETINEKYNNMAKELDAQLFVYDKETGKFIVDTINEKPNELSTLKSREYNDGYSYEMLANSDKGYSSFKSILTGEDLYIHYSTIEDFNWGIMLARYETQVFAETHKISRNLLVVFALIILIIAIYLELILRNEKNRAKLNSESSVIRHLLLEINRQHENINTALKRIQEFSGARSCFFADTDGEDYYYIKPSLKDKCLFGDERKYFVSELFRYAANIHTDDSSTGFMQIIPNNHLLKTNPEFYNFLLNQGIKDISFAIIADKDNHVSILGVINPKKSSAIRKLAEDVVVCFSIAIYNKKHLNKTELAATTDSLTGALNRVAYKKDILVFDEEKPENFSCIYIDVNELHIRNNKYGHAAGDEMLIYIANSLKEVFYGQHIYRMGGDEFLVFAENSSQDDIKKGIDMLTKQLESMDYHVAIGVSYRAQNTNTEEMVREAEIRMYEAKAQYYQNKENKSVSATDATEYNVIKTGIGEIDTLLDVMKDRYNGIYRVSLNTDEACRILMPTYLGYNETEKSFKDIFAKYVEDMVDPDFHRAMLSFINYDAIKRQLAKGNIPKITYKKVNSETVVLSVYSFAPTGKEVDNTLWVFEKI
ncbi:MAG: sensor domain-containing diguanylate cyclase [Acutalibacteraceae bacterium]|nr:sensor domain-containing diguanylate cyclase [Acutalibacteraceae bacterium]